MRFLTFILILALASCAPPQHYQWLNAAPDEETMPYLQNQPTPALCEMLLRSANDRRVQRMNQRVQYVLGQRGMNAWLCSPEAQECLRRGLSSSHVEAFSSCVSQQQMINLQYRQLKAQESSSPTVIIDRGH